MTRPSSPSSAAATSIPSCASSRSRASSTISTTSRSTTASARSSRCSNTWEANARACNLVRTFARVDGKVRYFNASEPDIPFAEVGTPTWDGLPLDRYLSLLDMLNPMHRLWSDGRWNKLTVAHGCYWKKCSFCDISLDYIARYDGAPAALLVDRIERIIAETGQTGFHLRRRSRAAQGPEGAGRRTAEAQPGDFLVGQHPLRKILHAGTLPPARRQRLHRRLRRPRSRLRPPADS